MTATALNPRTTDQRATAALRLAPPPRLSLGPAGSAPGRLDGAWWPRSRDLAAELRSLTAELDGRWGRITRATVNPAYWPEIPRKVQVSGHVMHVGWFAAEQDPHQLMLLSYRVGRWDLLVVPPETPPATAAWLMAAASDPMLRTTGSALMHEAEGHGTADPPADVTAGVRAGARAGVPASTAADGTAAGTRI